MKTLSMIAATTALTLGTFAVAQPSALPLAQTQAVEAYYAQNGVGDGDTYAIDPDQLTGAAKAAYDKQTKSADCAKDGYCPEAYAINAGGIDTLALEVDDGDGIYISVFTADGAFIAKGSQSESDDMNWNN